MAHGTDGLNHGTTALDALISSAQADLPSDEALGRLEASLLTKLAQGPAVTAPATATHLPKLFGLGVLAVGLCGGAWLALAPGQGTLAEASRDNAVAPARSATTQGAPVVLAHARGADESAPGAPGVGQGAEPTEAPAKAEAKVSPSSSAHASDVDGVALLQRARKELGKDPNAALSLLNAHEKRYPKSTLTQEREVLRTMALSALGRKSEASEKAREFTERFPDSAHQRKVQDSSVQ